MAVVEIEFEQISIALFSLLLVSLPIIPMSMYVDPYKRGFFCDDSSIKYPYRTDSVSSGLSFLYSFGLPLLFMIIGEMLYWRGETTTYIFAVANRSFSIPLLFGNLCKTVSPFVFGTAVNTLVMITCNLFVGELRPNFLAVCSPDPASYNCSVGYVEKYHCRTTEVKRLRNSRLSFPADHSSLNMYSMVYMSIYIQVAVSKNLLLMKPLLQVAAIFSAVLISLTHLYDHSHHWHDILGGQLLGVAIALFTVYAASDLVIPNPASASVTYLVAASRKQESLTKSSKEKYDEN